eukprot:TRINITY_DN36871_c0_g1_i1.p1 TRINITY_DN36871_c0_g1~~TRINITY_DN36871_c0_g1_i1.p1  ORF type:complete len:591 (-),score=87.44 TRINITY_DN36871_c0_g1_i1:291-2063(-)
MMLLPPGQDSLCGTKTAAIMASAVSNAVALGLPACGGPQAGIIPPQIFSESPTSPTGGPTARQRRRIVLGGLNFEGCKEGQMLLNDDELRSVASAARQQTYRCPEFANARLACCIEIPDSFDDVGGCWRTSRATAHSRKSRSRSSGRRQLSRAAGCGGADDPGSEGLTTRSRRTGRRSTAALPAKAQHEEMASATAATEEATAAVARPHLALPAVPDVSAVLPTSRQLALTNAPFAPPRPPVPLAREHFEVREVSCPAEREAAVRIHLSKNTFYEERELVRIRVHEGDPWRCRTWLLVNAIPQSPAQGSADGASASTGSDASAAPSATSGKANVAARATGSAGGAVVESTDGFGGLQSAGGDTDGASYLAAATLRLNPYTAGRGMWGQVLNMSVTRERHGLGTALIAGLEELLRREGVDVVVLYPAENGRAPAFWTSIGFCAKKDSLLPPEELISHERGGPLMPEFDPGASVPLPRWEKRIGPPAAEQDLPSEESEPEPEAEAEADVAQRGSRTRLRAFVDRGKSSVGLVAGRRRRVAVRSGNPQAPAKRYRFMPAHCSRLSGELLRAATSALQVQRARQKARLSNAPIC